MTSLRPLALFALLLSLSGCTTSESATATKRCRASASDQACQSCCMETKDSDRTNAYKLNAAGDCRCILRAWIFLQ